MSDDYSIEFDAVDGQQTVNFDPKEPSNVLIFPPRDLGPITAFVSTGGGRRHNPWEPDGS